MIKNSKQTKDPGKNPQPDKEHIKSLLPASQLMVRS
jgi:hypothetical protein